MNKVPDTEPRAVQDPLRQHNDSFVAFFGKMRGRGSGAAEKFSPPAELISIAILLLFGALILVVAFREGISRF